MRFYVGTCEMKWTHEGDLEQLWIRRELGDELFKEIQQDYYKPVILRSDSQTLPGDVYKRVDVYVDVEDSKQALLLALRGYLEVQAAAKR